MQRLFSTFAEGWPGAGLLLLRLLAAAMLIGAGVTNIYAGQPSILNALQIICIAGGIVLAIGWFTPVAGALAAAAKVCIAISQASLHLGEPSTALTQAILAAGLAMIGPGAWSIDARLFGRKRIDLSVHR